MTAREAITYTDAMLRLRAWKHARADEVARQRRRAELWKTRATVQSERAHQLELEVRSLRRRLAVLEHYLEDRAC